MAFGVVGHRNGIAPIEAGEAELVVRQVQALENALDGKERQRVRTDEPAYLDRNSKILLRAARQTARVVNLDKTDVIIGRQSIQWFPWVGTRALRTLSLLAKSANIACELDRPRLALTYRLSSPEEFYTHLRGIANSQPDAIALARLMPVKAVEKYDDYAPEQLLDEANAKSRLDVSGAVEAVKIIITT